MLINIYAEYLYSKKVCCISTLKTRSESITFSYGNIKFTRLGVITAKSGLHQHYFKAIVSQLHCLGKMKNFTELQETKLAGGNLEAKNLVEVQYKTMT